MEYHRESKKKTNHIGLLLNYAMAQRAKMGPNCGQSIVMSE